MAATVLAFAPVAVALLLLLAVWCDLATRTIPDSLSIALAALGLAARGAEGVAAAAASLLVAAGLFAALLPLVARGSFGGGDTKLIAGLAVGFDPLTTVDFLLLTVVAGGVLGAAYLLLRLLPRPAPLAPQRAAWLPRRVFALERRRFNRRGPLPYAVAIAAGGILTLVKPFGG